MVVTGWYHAEAYSDDGSLVCRLPQTKMSHHMQIGLTLCGHTDECVALEDNEWKVTHKLHQERSDSVFWKSPKGIMLMNGCCKYKDIGNSCGSCNKTVELLKDDGTTEEAFKMTYDYML